MEIGGAGLAILASCGIGLVPAEEFQENVGFSPNHMFESGQYGENVDVTTGNLNLSLPIGPTYQVNDLTHQIILSYNSKIWQYRSPDVEDVLGNSNESARNPYLKMDSNFGEGWSYHEGRLFVDPNATFIYQPGVGAAMPSTVHFEAPDGAKHALYAEDVTNPVYYYSKDSSYLRARAYEVYVDQSDPDPEPTESMLVWKLWEPDGNARVLGYQVGSGQPVMRQPYEQVPIDPDDNRIGWYTIRRESPIQREIGSAGCATPDELFLDGPNGGVTNRIRVNGSPTELQEVPCNYIEYFYQSSLMGNADPSGLRSNPMQSSDTGHGANPIRFIRDSVGRVIEIQYGSAQGAVGDISVQFPPHPGVTEIRYDLTIDTESVQGPLASNHLLEDSGGQCVTGTGGGDPNWTPDVSTQVPLLKAVTYPNGYQMTFSYDGPGCERHGVMTERVLPTGARSDYLYHAYRTWADAERSFSLIRRSFTVDGQESVWEYARDPIQLAALSTLISKTITDSGDSCLAKPALDKIDMGHCYPDPDYDLRSYSNPPRVYELDPDGNLTTYFLYYNKLDLENYPQPERYGTTLAMYKHQGAPVNQIPLTVTTYKYDYELYDIPGDKPGPFQQSRPVNIRKKEVVEGIYSYEQDLVMPKMTTYSDFDGYGNYQKTSEHVLDNTAQIYRQTTRRSLVDSTNPDLSALQLAAGVSPESYIDRWILGVSTSETIRKSDTGPVIARSEVSEFDPFGNVLVQVAYADADAGTGAVTTTQQFNDLGALTSITTSALVEGQNLTRSTFLTVDQAGHVEGKQFGNLAWTAFHRDVDLLSGKVMKSWTPSGVETNYSYDELGRLTAITPASTEYATTIAYPSVQLTTVTQGVSGDRIEARYHYDQAGRLIEEERVAKDGTFNKKSTQYDQSGRLIFESEWVPASFIGTLPGTTIEYWTPLVGPVGPITYGSNPDSYSVDRLGRKTRTIQADGSITEWIYDGVKTWVTTKDLNQTPDGSVVAGVGLPTSATTELENDGFGRLVHVVPADGFEATYSYDELDNLVTVDMGTQTRSFQYDSLGRLLLASHPESGTTTYDLFDPAGKVLRQTDEAGTIRWFEYDDAGRVLMEKMGPTKVLRKKFEYDSFSWAQGMLTRVWSYDPEGTFEVRRNFYYQGLNGRLSKESLVLFDPNDLTDAITTSYEYNNFGLVSNITYPERNPAEHSATTVQFAYQNGILKRVWDGNTPGLFLDDVDYNAAGGTKIIKYKGNVRTEIVPDVMNRPSQITVKGPQSGLASLDTDRKRDGDLMMANGWESWIANRPVATSDPEEGPIPLPRDLIAQIVPDPPPGGGGGGGGTTTFWDSGPYTYDGAGNIILIGPEYYPGDTAGVRGPDWYNYDALSRLTAAYVTKPKDTGYHELIYQYDGYGNMSYRSDQIDGTSPLEWIFTVNPANRIVNLEYDTGDTSTSWQHDFNYDSIGNLTSDGQKNYLFDVDSRLKEVRQVTGEGLGRYSYDDRGYRFRKVEDGVETFYVRNADGQVLSEFRRPDGSQGFPVWDQDYVYALGQAIALVKNDTPQAPAALISSTGVDGQGDLVVTLSWAKSEEPDIAGYRVYRRRIGNGALTGLFTAPGYSVEQASAGDPVTFTDDPATPHDYEYWVITVDTAALESAESRHLEICTTNCDPVSVIWDSSPVTPGDHSVELDWTSSDPTRTLGYTIHRRETGASQWVPINPTSLWLEDGFLDTGLTNGQSYDYAVTVRSTDGLEATPESSQSHSVIPLDNVLPTPPGNVRGHPIDGGFTVYWDPSNSADRVGYEVYKVSTGEMIAEVDSNTLSVTISAGAGNVVVKTVDDDGNRSAPSVAVTAYSFGSKSIFEVPTIGSDKDETGANVLGWYGKARFPGPSDTDELLWFGYYIDSSPGYEGWAHNYGLPVAFYGARIYASFSGWEQFTECPGVNIYRSSPSEPEWQLVTSDPFVGELNHQCGVTLEDRHLEESEYTYHVTVIPNIATGGEYGPWEITLVDMYEANEVMGQYAYGANLATLPDESGYPIQLRSVAIPPTGGWELGGYYAGTPVVIRWKKSRHSDVVGYRIWVYDHARSTVHPVTNLTSWEHLADVPAWETSYFDYDAPCNWPIEEWPGCPGDWNEGTCTVYAGAYNLAQERPDGTHGWAYYVVEGITSVNQALIPPPSYFFDLYTNEYTEQVRAVRLCDGECPNAADYCIPYGFNAPCGCSSSGGEWEQELLHGPDTEALRLASATCPAGEDGFSRTGGLSEYPRSTNPETPIPSRRVMPLWSPPESEVLGGLEIRKAKGVTLAAAANSDRREPDLMQDRLVGAVAPGSTIQYLHVDHLGSTRLITDASGNAVSWHKHLPFGDDISPAGSDGPNTHKFTGHERDGDTGLDYMAARYYESVLCRFPNSDPGMDVEVTMPYTWNLYAYARNSPILLVDPKGTTVTVSGSGKGQGIQDLEDRVGMQLSVDKKGELVSEDFVGPRTPEQQMVESAISSSSRMHLDFDGKQNSGVLYAVATNGRGRHDIDTTDTAALNNPQNSSQFTAGGVVLHELAEAFAEVTGAASVLGVSNHQFANLFGSPGLSSTLSAHATSGNGGVITAMELRHNVQDGSGTTLVTNVKMVPPMPKKARSWSSTGPVTSVRSIP